MLRDVRPPAGPARVSLHVPDGDHVGVPECAHARTLAELVLQLVDEPQLLPVRGQDLDAPGSHHRETRQVAVGEQVGGQADDMIQGVLGVVLFLLSFWVVDKIFPYTLWKEIIEEHNTALAVLIGLMALGLSIIIAAAIH